MNQPQRLDQDGTRWLTITEAAKYRGVSESTLRRYERIGRIKPDRTPGGHRRYTREQLDSLFAAPGAA